MAGKKFLNPIYKIILCSLGMFLMGYFIYMSYLSETMNDKLTIARVLVFLAFAYLLARSIQDIGTDADS